MGRGIIKGLLVFTAAAFVVEEILPMLLDAISEGVEGAELLYAAVMSNTRIVVKAIDDAAKALKKTVKELQKFKFFPVIKRFTPAIFTFTVAALATHPWWFMLKYVGAGPAGALIAGRNRAIVRATWGYLMAAAPAGYELDEFPYARTWEGGYGAMACPVPKGQNRRHGGLFGAFCRWTMRGTPGQFIVVPIPL